MDINWELLNKIAIITTIFGIPSVLILYFTIGRKIGELLRINKDKYISKRLSGKITFDYSNNNGIFKVGKGKQFFELKFSKASDVSIHIYNDPKSIEGVAIAKGFNEIYNIKNSSIFDMSSRTRTIREGEVAIFKNIEGNYCAIKVLDVKDDSRRYNRDEISFEYIINIDGYTDFRK